MCYFKKNKQIIRKSFNKNPQLLPVPFLLAIQINSFRRFLERDPKCKRGLEYELKSFFPIIEAKRNIEIRYIKYKISKPEDSPTECKIKSKTYFSPLYITFQLIKYKNLSKSKKIKEIIEQEVFMGEIPLMTSSGSFIINGTERVVVSQLHRSTGIIFDHDKGKSHPSGKILYRSRVLPKFGSWLDFEFDVNDQLHLRVNRGRKIPIYLVLKALGYSSIEILRILFKIIKFKIINNKFYTKFIPYNFKNAVLNFDIKFKDKIYVKKNVRIDYNSINRMKEDNVKEIEIPINYIIGSIASKNYYNKKNKIIIRVNDKISIRSLAEIIKNKIFYIETIFVKKSDNLYIKNILNVNYYNKDSALKEIYKIIKPGEYASKELSEIFFKKIFLDKKTYNLSAIGRYKLNKSLGVQITHGSNNLTRNDIVRIIKKMIDIRNKVQKIDNIDDLSHRKIQSVGEMLLNQFSISLFRIKKMIKLYLKDKKNKIIVLERLINPKILSTIMKRFFTLSPLSQFMDQNNPLSEITHKRRISSLGPGGLNRERANFEIRDVNYTHYGKMCPVETPEGPNIGLITSLALYAYVNKDGFLETPYFCVIKCKIIKEVHYLSAEEESRCVIAQASANLDDNNNLTDEFILCRYKGESGLFNRKEVNYVDVSMQQILSVGVSLIPFLEHNDANRALMGANMQRQSVPNLIAESPLIGTGIEKIITIDSGYSVVAIRGGVVKFLDSKKIIIKVNSDEINKYNDIGIDIYRLTKYTRSNQNTCINQKPIVYLNEKINIGDIIADGSANDKGELSLGHNVMVAFMPWKGYNFEDAILISERLLKDDLFTTLHIQELSCVIKETKLGPEVITECVPNVSSVFLKKLNNIGIVRMGSFVNGGDVLVGKVTPKITIQFSPEERLLKAIFGERTTDFKDSSLKMTSELSGTVIDIKTFNRQDVVKNIYEMIIEKKKIFKEEQNIMQDFKILESVFFINMSNLILNKKIKNERILPKKIILRIVLKNKSKQIELERIRKEYYNEKREFIYKLLSNRKNIKKIYTLPIGIITVIKILIAIKKPIQVGDKMSGRHGNKGVISRINPIEDMPYDENGIPVDIVLNPLGVPSRMNIGQILETHLGLASRGIGDKINKMIKKKEKIYKIRSFMQKVYSLGVNPRGAFNLKYLSDNEVLDLAKSMKLGMPMATPVFDGAKKSEIRQLLKLCDLPPSGQVILFDGCTGEKIEKPVTIGYLYMLKLNHLVDDKMHARSTGSYSLITQQPLGGKSQFGGQRFGEMEVWALEAYGAAYTLQEMLTVKSDDIEGRTKIYKNIINNNYKMETTIPESFNVLMKEIRSLCINIELKK